MSYTPRPIDTSGVALGDDLRQLVESLASNVHDRWAQQRLADGWRWGPHRDDAARTHPDLVPYEELPEAEKEIDRQTASETLKALLALGFRIEPPPHDPHASLDQDDTARNTAENLAADLVTADPTTLLSFWAARASSASPMSAASYRLLAERLRAVGESLFAYDAAREGLDHWPNDLRLRQMLGLALADSGDPERAQAILAQLVAEGHEDEETLGILARTHKDLWARASDASDRAEHLRLAHECYRGAYRRTGGYWTGINAATLAALSGDSSAGPLAADVSERCLLELERVDRDGSDRYWLLATLGEASLVSANWRRAADWYEQAGSLGRSRGGDLASTRRNARLLLALPGVPDPVRRGIEASLRPPPVLMFTGHMVDRPDRDQPRFPAELESAVAAAIRGCLDDGPPVAFGSGASGSDLLFLETVLDLGGEVNLVLPYEVDEFEAESVDRGLGGDWSARFRRALDRASRVVVASERCRTPSPSVYAYANQLMRGLAIIRARQLDAELRGLAVWDGQQGDGPGGTAATVGDWMAAGVRIEIIDPRALTAAAGSREGTAPSKQRDAAMRGDDLGAAGPSSVKAMLFADAVGFSRLSEEQVPLFVERFLGTVAAVRARADRSPLMQNTWGDGLFFVFDTPASTGRFALDLCDSIRACAWQAVGLPAELSLRIGLHAGPVLEHVDPVTGLLNYFGTHVSRTARIEPITPPGQVYASEAFAALCAAQHTTDLLCDYVGQTPLAKGYGTFRTYHVRRPPR